MHAALQNQEALISIFVNYAFCLLCGYFGKNIILCNIYANARRCSCAAELFIVYILNLGIAT